MSASTPDVAAHFANAAETFDQSPISRQLAGMAQQLMALLDTAAGGHWLDFGAGTGMLSVPLAGKVDRVTALDTSDAMLEKIRQKGIANVETLNQDIFCGLPQTYHGIVSSMALHHVADIPALFGCLHGNLQPGGQIALIDLFSEDGSFHPDNAAMGVHHLGFDPDVLLQQAAQAGFVELQIREFFRVTHQNGREYPLFLLQGRA